jgi:hypothetical protein
MTKRKRETAHKNVRRNYRSYMKKKLRKKVAILLIRKGNVNTPFTQKIQAKFGSLKTKGQTKIEENGN